MGTGLEGERVPKDLISDMKATGARRGVHPSPAAPGDADWRGGRL
jgi:hypothetical protein